MNQYWYRLALSNKVILSGRRMGVSPAMVRAVLYAEHVTDKGVWVKEFKIQSISGDGELGPVELWMLPPKPEETSTNKALVVPQTAGGFKPTEVINMAEYFRPTDKATKPFVTARST